ncbi:MAG: hypothetical protein JWR69_1840 [Pedosphaera sp.]|nr:hypothetical protein [Pedosphaera sp.]
MIATLVEPQSWPKRRWWKTVALVMLGQLGLIFWLTDLKPATPRTPSLEASIYLPAEKTIEFPDLQDPTLSALPNRHGFSGPAWMNEPPLAHPVLDWVEEPLWLTQPTGALGGAFSEFINTNKVASIEVVKRLEPQLDPTGFYSLTYQAPTQSTVRLEGELANRPLMSPLTLSSWPVAESLLTNSVVEIGVWANGRVFSAVLLAGSGLREADNSALNLARTVRFRSLLSAKDLSWGKLVFQWHTIAPASTNAATAGP